MIPVIYEEIKDIEDTLFVSLPLRFLSLPFPLSFTQHSGYTMTFGHH